MASPIGRCRWVCCVVAAMALAPAPVLAAARPQVFDAVVRVPPATKPVVYLRFRNNKLWVAPSLAELARVTPLRANGANREQDAESGAEDRWYNFPEIDLPAPPNSTEQRRVSFYYSRTLGTGRNARAGAPEDRIHAGASLSLSRQDDSGVTWTYSARGTADRATAEAATRPLELILPQLDSAGLKLVIETKLEGRNARIGLKVRDGERDLAGVQKNNASAPATLEIVDTSGATIVSEQGDLTKFGFT